MLNQQSLEGNWNEIVAQLRAKWASLSSEDLEALKSNVEQLVGYIQGKTGEAREAVECVLTDLSASGAQSLQQASHSVQQLAQQVASETSEKAALAAESVRHGYREAEGAIRRHPGEAAAICFGAGVVVGVILGLALRR